MKTHPNCFPAGHTIHSTGAVGASRRWFSGEIVDIETVSGYQLSVTPNHPILTDRGWIAAGLLNESSYVVSSSAPERMIATIDPDNNNTPSFIEQVFESLRSALGMPSYSVPATAENFHGDGKGSNVDIVLASSLLQSSFDTALIKPLAQEYFSGIGMKLLDLSGLCSQHQLINRSLAATHGGMGSSDIGRVLLSGTTFHHEAVGFGRRAQLNASNAQPGVDSRSRNFIMAGQGVDRLAILEALDNLSIGNSQLGAAGLGHSSSADIGSISLGAQEAASLERVAESCIASVPLSSSALKALTSQVHFDRVLKVSKRSFSGHVYNLQTKPGWYISNNIITHNCRCALVPVVEGVEIGITGPAWFARQSAGTQRAILGPGKLKLYQAGQMQLSDLVGENALGRFELPLKELSIGA